MSKLDEKIRLERAINALNNIGISAFEDDGTYRTFNNIMEDLVLVFEKIKRENNECNLKRIKDYTLSEILG